MTEDQATISSRCRDEKMAKKMNLPFRFREKTLFENKKDSPFLTTKDPPFLKMKKSFWEQEINLQFCSTWEVINSPVDTFSEMLARPGLTSEQVILPENKVLFHENKMFFLRTNFFSWEPSAFPREQSLFLRTNYFSWEQSAADRPRLDKDLFSRWSFAATSDAVGRTKWPLRTAGSVSSTQSKNCKAKLDRWAAWILAHISNSFSFSNSFWLKTKDYCNNLYWATWTLLRAF